MRVILNGFQQELPANTTVLALLEREGEPVGHVLVEVNLRHVRPESYGETTLREGDRVEVIHPLFGG